MAACKVQSYKPRTNEIKSKFNNKINYASNEHCNIVTERFKSSVICHNENKFNQRGSNVSLNKIIKYEKHKGFHRPTINGSIHLRNIFSVPTDVSNLCGKIRIRKSRHYGEEAM